MRYATTKAIIFAALLGSCQDGSSTAEKNGADTTAKASALPSGGACALIDKQIADAVLEGPSRGPIQEGGAANVDQCQYMHEGERIMDVRTATVVILPADLATMRGSLGEYGKGVEEVAGIGDAAIWIPATTSLYVGKGGHTLSFSVTAHEMDMRAKSIDLARAALTKL